MKKVPIEKITPIERDFIELHRLWKKTKELYESLSPEYRLNVPEPGKEPIFYKGKVFL